MGHPYSPLETMHPADNSGVRVADHVLKSGIGLQLVDSHRNGVLLGALKAMDLFGFSDQGQFSVNGQRADVNSSRMR